MDGLCWRVGVGDHISIWNDHWVPGVTEDRFQNNNSGESIKVVADLINEESRTWNRDLIISTFNTDITRKILQLPLSKTIHEDIQVWRGEATGIFSVRSTYKLLQESTIDPNDYLQADSKNFYRKLWNLHMPSKIKITVWKIAWNYIPNFSNLKLKRVMTENRCSRCGQEEEDSFHVFQSVGTNEQCMGFCCELWGIWTSRNKLIYEDKYSTSWDISKQIKSYISKLEGIKERVIALEVSARPRQSVQGANKSIFFDAAFDSQNHRSASGLIVKNEEGRIVEEKSILHDNVASQFAAEAHAGFQATRFYFIPRSENVEAHKLAKRSLQKEEEQYLVGETSQSICDELEPNRLGYSKSKERG
ncbi:uncharacterized protein LOC105773801 [Gossypium raimondii]|uniref:uncharacterized protein LOC105773801 n=1 Tax=Gossypium raimondii TaxID=29730 RepID=UPI00227C3EB0|nr:uncharacterized protein LOC105773801 [Gossypium raimondii]